VLLELWSVRAQAPAASALGQEEAGTVAVAVAVAEAVAAGTVPGVGTDTAEAVADTVPGVGADTAAVVGVGVGIAAEEAKEPEEKAGRTPEGPAAFQ
jgi:hypothetical protein